MSESKLNRRGFISSLVGLVAWVKGAKTKSEFLPVASPIQLTCSIDEAARCDGTDVLDQVVSISGDRAMLVNNANVFQAGQMIDVHRNNAVFQYVGTFVVTEENIRRNEIHVMGPLFPKVGVGDLLVVHKNRHTPELGRKA